MNVFDFDIWNKVQHNGKFSHTVRSHQTVHALNEEGARKKVELKPSERWEHSELVIVTSGEFVYSVEKAGRVEIHPYYVYSDGRKSLPVKQGKR